MPLSFTEKELQNFLCNKKNLKKYTDLRLLKNQFFTTVGYVDMVAYDSTLKSFVIIKLKNNALDIDTYFKLKRQMSCIKKYRDITISERDKRRKNDQRLRDIKVSGLLLGCSLDDALIYSVKFHGNADEDNISEDIFYRLFYFDFDTPISFNYLHSKQQSWEALDCPKIGVEHE